MSGENGSGEEPRVGSRVPNWFDVPECWVRLRPSLWPQRR